MNEQLMEALDYLRKHNFPVICLVIALYVVVRSQYVFTLQRQQVADNFLLQLAPQVQQNTELIQKCIKDIEPIKKQFVVDESGNVKGVATNSAIRKIR